MCTWEQMIFADSGAAPLAVAAIALQGGVDPILHLNGRDRNRIALQSEIIGAVTAGVSSIVVRRGKKLPSMLRGRVKGVFDTKTTQLLSIASRVSEREELGEGNALYIGCMVPPMRTKEDWEAALIREKLESGAQFLQTRPIFNPKLLREYAAALVSQKITRKARLIAGFPLMTSLASARSIGERYSGTTVPDPMIQRLSDAEDTRAEGIAVLTEQLMAAAETPGVSGVAIVNVDDIDAVIEAVKPRRRERLAWDSVRPDLEAVNCVTNIHREIDGENRFPGLEVEQRDGRWRGPGGDQVVTDNAHAASESLPGNLRIVDAHELELLRIVGRVAVSPLHSLASHIAQVIGRRVVEEHPLGVEARVVCPCRQLDLGYQAHLDTETDDPFSPEPGETQAFVRTVDVVDMQHVARHRADIGIGIEALRAPFSAASPRMETPRELLAARD